MEFLRYRVKVMEAFKDGNILGGRFLKPGEILVISESDFVKITNSGGTLEVMESLIPNPKKEAPEVVETKLAQLAELEAQAAAKEAELAQAEAKLYRAEVDEKPVAKKRGRPKKVDNAS